MTAGAAPATTKPASKKAAASTTKAKWPDPARIAQVEKLGIVPTRDKVTSAPSMVRYIARKELVIGTYRCPVKSRVEINKFMTYIIPPGLQDCKTKKNKNIQGVKLSPKGIASPL